MSRADALTLRGRQKNRLNLLGGVFNLRLLVFAADHRVLCN